MKIIFVAVLGAGALLGQAPQIPSTNTLQTTRVDTNTALNSLYNLMPARTLATMAGLYEVPLSVTAPIIRSGNIFSLNMWGSGARPVAAGGLGVSGHCMQWGAAGATDAGFACGSGGGSVTDFSTTKTSSTVITVLGGTFRYGTNVITLAGPLTFTLQTVAIASIGTGATTTINTAVPMTNLVNGQAINVALTGTGPGCVAGAGVFVATKITTSQLTVPADTSAGCTFTSGTVGAQAGGTVIVYGNSSGQIEMSHSAALGALISVSGTGGVVNQSSTATFPNGSVPIASITVTAGVFDTVTDYRASLSGMQVQSGQGIDVTMSGGQAQVNVTPNVALVDQPSTWLNSVVMKDATKTLPWRTGTGLPNERDNCSNTGEAFFQTDTPTLWICTVAGTPGTWSSITGGSLGSFTLTSLTNSLLLGLTNSQLLNMLN